MYAIPNEIRDKIYEDGGVEYTPIVTIGNTPISLSNIKSLKLSRPIINKEDKYMHLGSFISDKLTMALYKPEEIDFSQKVHLSVQMATSNYDVTTVPIGEYNIETSPMDYYKMAEIVALDNAVLFKDKVNISNFFTNGQITVENLLIALCNHFGVTLGTYPTTNKDRTTSSFDGTTSGKQYIAWVAEIMGGNAKMGRNGELNIIPFKSNPVTTINALKGQSFKLKDIEYLDGTNIVTVPYEVTHVSYDMGVWEVHTPNTDESKNTIPINIANVFFNGTSGDMNDIIEALAPNVIGTIVNRVEVLGVADITLDPTDLVTYTLGDRSYQTFYDCEITFTGAKPMVKVSVDIPSDNVENTTNTIVAPNVSEEMKKLETIVDQLNNTITQIATRTTNIETNIGVLNDGQQSIVNNLIQTNTNVANLDTLTTRMERTLADTYTKDEIKAIAKGVSEDGTIVEITKTTASQFDINGLTITGSDSNGVSSNLSPTALTIARQNDNTELLYVGYNATQNESQIRTYNMRIANFLEMGSYSRFQDYIDDANRAGTGCFWVGD